MMNDVHTTKSMTQKDAKTRLRALGLALRKMDGEYRVNFRGGKEATAYYTNDIADAVATGEAMFRKQREDAADAAFADADFLDPVKDTGGWLDLDENEWQMTVFFEAEDDEPSTRGVFVVRFEPGTNRVVDAYLAG